ncbi:hypothetical protein [Parasphingorhabdus sp.]|uniref:hypothetical protein n=1 Tax=Parasphingorhabdus sp. TaxID=2709688 RepID=UPI00326388A2
MAKISEHFGLNQNQGQLNFVDVDTQRDKALFIDPHAIGKSSDDWSVSCHQAITSFFQAIVDAIRADRGADGLTLLNGLHEPNETSLGLSKGEPAGRGIGRIQAQQLYNRIRDSRAAQTGILNELSDCELFVPLIGEDKISDITTNVIRRQLIQFTQSQCELKGIPVTEGVPSGFLWNQATSSWDNQYTDLPVVDGRKILLVPKSAVRWNMSFSHAQFRDHFVLNFLQDEHLRNDTRLVETLNNGRRRVPKSVLKQHYRIDKEFLARFASEHPEVLARYKAVIDIPPEPTLDDLTEHFDEPLFARELAEELTQIDRGNAHATRYHKFISGVLEFLFYPYLTMPEMEYEVNEGRKRIDIVYTNNSSFGFFGAMLAHPRVGCRKLIVECKNYSKDCANPELDQIAGRFAPLRGKLGFLLGRGFDDRQRFIERCKDTAREERGVIIPLVDDDIIEMLRMVENRNRNLIEDKLQRLFDIVTE